MEQTMWDRVSDPVGPSEARLAFFLRQKTLSSYARPGRVEDPSPHNLEQKSPAVKRGW